jgi:hypothetical protein
MVMRKVLKGKARSNLKVDGQSQTIKGFSFNGEVACETGSYTTTPLERGIYVGIIVDNRLLLTCS